MGILKKLKTKVVVAKEDWQKRRAYSKAAEKQIKKKAEEAYYKARLKERMKVAEFKAKMVRETEERRLKARYTPRKPISFGGLTGFGQPISIFGGSQQSYFKPKSATKLKPKIRVKRRKIKVKKKKQKYIIRGGKAYPIG